MSFVRDLRLGVWHLLEHLAAGVRHGWDRLVGRSR